MSGAEGGPGKRAGHKASTAPRSDPYFGALPSWRWGEAGGSRSGDRRGRWEQPRQSRVGSGLPDGSGPVSETERYTRGTGVVTPLDTWPALTRWMWAGVRCAPAVPVISGVVGNSRLGLLRSVREAMVKVHGVAMARPQG